VTSGRTIPSPAEGCAGSTSLARPEACPHNLVVAELSENGVIGLLAVLVLITNTLMVLLPRRDPIGEAAFLILVFEVLFGLTGIFWVAGTFTLPFLMVGLAIGDRNPLTARSQRRALTSPSQ